jgi:hypothetical protein
MTQSYERLLRQEAAYLKDVIAAVAAEKPRPVAGDKGDKLDAAAEQALERIKQKIEARYFGYRFAVFLEIGLPAEWRRQAALAATPPAPTPPAAPKR